MVLVQPNNNAQLSHALGYVVICSLLSWLIFAVVVVAAIDGFMIYKGIFTRLETMYFSGLLGGLLVYVGIHGIKRTWATYLIIALTSVLLGALLVEATPARLIDDLRYLARSYLLGVLVFAYVWNRGLGRGGASRFFKLQWMLLASLVLIHFIFGVGRKHDVIQKFYFSYFQEGNVISFFFVVTWFYFYTRIVSGFKRGVFTLTSLVVAVLMSSKASIIALMLLACFHWLAYFKEKSKRNAFVVNSALTISTILVIVFFSDLLDFFLQVLIYIFPDGEIMLKRLQSWDVLTVLTSTRNLRVIELYSAMQEYSVWQMLFGVGFNEALSTQIVESDPFDIFKALGLVGVLVFYTPPLLMFVVMKSDQIVRRADFKYHLFSLGTLYAVLFVSTATGHVLLTPMAMILLGVVFGNYMWLRSRLYHKLATLN